MKCCEISLSDFRHKITIQRKQDAPDGFGGSVTTWVNVAQPWARMKPKSGSEKVYLGRLDAKSMASIVVRYNSNYAILESDKLIARGVEYNIRSIVNIEERDKYLELLVESGVAQ